MLLIFALVFQSAFATVNCRDMLLTQVDFGEIQLREPLRRDLSERQRDSEELDLEAQSLRWAAAEVESDARQLQARLTRLEILVLARLDCPLTPRAARLRRTWATVYDAKKEAKAADESAHQAYERLQRFVLDKLARESERLEELVAARRDLDYALRVSAEAEKQLKVVEHSARESGMGAMITVGLTPAEIGFFNRYPHLWPTDEFDSDVKKLNEKLAQLLPPAHNLGVRPGWSFARVPTDMRFVRHLARTRALTAAIARELRDLSDELDAILMPLVANALAECRPD